MVLANHPFSGRIDKDRIVDDVKVGTTSATEILFLKYMMDSLKPGGRCGVIIPEGVLRGTTIAHLELRRVLLRQFSVQAVIGLPHFAFKPYASVATYILVFSKTGSTKRIWMYLMDNDGYSHDALREPMEKDDIPDLLKSWFTRDSSSYVSVERKHGYIDVDKVTEFETVLVPKLYLRGYDGTDKYPSVTIGSLCSIRKGKSPATKTPAGVYPFVTTAEELKTANNWDFEGKSVCVPLVSSTGHGHASIKKITFVDGQFAAAIIVAVLQVKASAPIIPEYLYYFLVSHKDDVLVSLMSGAANVSLSVTKISSVKIPVPSLDVQKELVGELCSADKRIKQLKSEIATLENSHDVLLSELCESLRS